MAQILAPRAIGRLADVRNHHRLISAVGVREIASGVAILAQVKPRGWIWARVEAVHVKGDKHSHWVVRGPGGTTVEWDAEIVEDRPNELIRWRSLPGADVSNAGVVIFEPSTGGRGTVVRVELEYEPPGGVFGATVAKLLGEAPEEQVPVDLMRLRQVLETGIIQSTEGQPAGRLRSTSRKFDDFVRV